VVIIMGLGKALLNWQNYNRIGNPHYLASTSGRCRRADKRRPKNDKKSSEYITSIEFARI
jgi:hypothetical protein